MMDRQNYFEMLGVKESADGNDISKKYMSLAKIWHPDRLPPELSQLRPWVEEIFHLFTVASDTLGDAKKRVEYQKTVMQGGGTPESERKLNVMVEAAINFQKVDVLVKRRRYDDALADLRRGDGCRSQGSRLPGHEGLDPTAARRDRRRSGRQPRSATCFARPSRSTQTTCTATSYAPIS